MAGVFFSDTLSTRFHFASIVSADRFAPQSHSIKYPPFVTFTNSEYSFNSSNASSENNGVKIMGSNLHGLLPK